MVRQCSTCGKSKDRSEFWAQKSRSDGLQAECKVCMRERNNAWQRKHKAKRNKEKIEGIVMARIRNPKKAWLKGAKDNARARGIAFGLTEDDVVVPEFCPILGIKLESQMGRGVKRTREIFDAAPSIDRIDNSKGYFPDNIVVVSYRANRIKNDASIDELRAIADWYDALRNSRQTAEGRVQQHIELEDGRKPDDMSEMLSSSSQEAGAVLVAEDRC